MADGRVEFHAYLDAGTPEAPEHIMEAWLKDEKGENLIHWDTAMLSALPKDHFHNDYAYNQFKTSRYGIQAIVGSAATITLPAGRIREEADILPDGPITLVLMDMAGHTFSVPLTRESE